MIATIERPFVDRFTARQPALGADTLRALNRDLFPTLFKAVNGSRVRHAYGVRRFRGVGWGCFCGAGNQGKRQRQKQKSHLIDPFSIIVS